VELKLWHLLVKFLYLLVRLSEEVIRRLGGNLALKFCADLIGSRARFFELLARQPALQKRRRSPLLFSAASFCFAICCSRSCDALFKLVSGSLVLLFELL